MIYTYIHMYGKRAGKWKNMQEKMWMTELHVACKCAYTNLIYFTYVCMSIWMLTYSSIYVCLYVSIFIYVNCTQMRIGISNWGKFQIWVFLKLSFYFTTVTVVNMLTQYFGCLSILLITLTKIVALLCKRNTFNCYKIKFMA